MSMVRYGSTVGSMSQTFLHFLPSSLHSRIFLQSGLPSLGLSDIAKLLRVSAFMICGFLNSTVISLSLSSILSASAFIDLSEYGSLTARTYRSLP